MNSPKVFICYVSEDREEADKVFYWLKEKGCSPWMDKDFLRPGQNWELEIKDRIINSDFFLALISSNFLNKRGFVQTEFKLGLSTNEEIPATKDFFIPALLEECEPKDARLKKIHMAKLCSNFDEGMNDILRSILPNIEFESKLELILKDRKRITSFDIYAVTGGSFSKIINDNSGIEITSIRFILPSRNAIKSVYRKSYKPNDIRKLYDSHKKARKKIYESIGKSITDISTSSSLKGNAEFREFNGFPAMYYAIIDNSELIAGEYLYLKNEGKFGMKAGKPVQIFDNNSVKKAKCHFDSIWKLSQEISS